MSTERDREPSHYATVRSACTSTRSYQVRSNGINREEAPRSGSKDGGTSFLSRVKGRLNLCHKFRWWRLSKHPPVEEIYSACALL